MRERSRRNFIKRSATLAAAPLLPETPFLFARHETKNIFRDNVSAFRIRRRIIPTPFGQVHVRSTQAKGLPLLLLHMTPLSGAMFEPLMDEMSKERTLIAPDRLGYGASDAPPRQLTMEEYAQSTLAVLDGYGHKQADVLGIHTGSIEAIELAFAKPNRFRRVGVIAVPLFDEAELLERRTKRAIPPPPPAEDGSHLLEVWRRRFLLRSPPFDLAYLHWTVVEELKARPYAGMAYKAVYDYPVAERLKALTRPLIVFGAHDDAMAQTERSRAFLPPIATYLDLPDFQLDIFHVKVKEMSDLMRLHFALS